MGRPSRVMPVSDAAPVSARAEGGLEKGTGEVHLREICVRLLDAIVEGG